MGRKDKGGGVEAETWEDRGESREVGREGRSQETEEEKE